MLLYYLILYGLKYTLFRIISWKTTSHKDHLEVCFPNSRLLSGLYGMWSSMKMTLRGYWLDFNYFDRPGLVQWYMYKFHDLCTLQYACYYCWYLISIVSCPIIVCHEKFVEPLHELKIVLKSSFYKSVNLIQRCWC